jgi:hypothetical protein
LGGQIVVDAPRPGRVYLPGSFNPLHKGHRRGTPTLTRRHPDLRHPYDSP